MAGGVRVNITKNRIGVIRTAGGISVSDVDIEIVSFVYS
jgi:hypothetical protein